MSDHVLVNRIAIYAYHGVNPAEEKLGQRFFVSLDAELDTAAAGANDDWHSTACYSRMTEIVTTIATGRRFHIIEALAEAVASELLAAIPRLKAITVQIDKPSAPIPAIIDGVSVRITRRREGSV